MGHIPAGEAARRAQVSVQTLRYYERRGLLKRPARAASNYRLYTEEAVSRVRFIKRAQRLGFDLEAIRDLLALRAARSTSARFARVLKPAWARSTRACGICSRCARRSSNWLGSAPAPYAAPRARF
jgi:DNA-binding transcriptional MerR regulator